MQQIKCPKCGEVFTIDEASYDSIVNQIRNHEFAEELKRKEAELKLSEASRYEIKAKTAQLQFNSQLAAREKELEELKGRLNTKEKENEVEIQKAVNEYLVKIETLQAEARLQNDKYNVMLESKNKEIQQQEELVEQYKNFKLKQSTKMIGESLEQYCQNEFNKVRAGMFPKAEFSKDNDASSGSKGDFIFRETDEHDEEIVSIMFEMKNQVETTAKKHKNEDFFKELDKDRTEKKCEYAILVSMLEEDSDLYNEGIVDVSYKYPKMYVVRPQFFIPIITLIRNASLKVADYKHQLTVEKNRNLDFSNFEENINSFKNSFGKNYETASRKFAEAIAGIDKTIKQLEKTRADLVSSDRQLRLANDKAQNLTIRQLTKNAPSVAQQIEEAGKK